MSDWKEQAQAAFENGQKIYADYVRMLPKWQLDRFALPMELAKLGITARSFELGHSKGILEYKFLAILDDDFQIGELVYSGDSGLTVEFALYHRYEYIRSINNPFELGGALKIAERIEELRQTDEVSPRVLAQVEYNGVWERITYETLNAKA